MLPARESFEASEKAGTELYKRLKIGGRSRRFSRALRRSVASSEAMEETILRGGESYIVKFRLLQRWTRSFAASGQWG